MGSFASFIRLKICLYVAALSATGFLLSGPVSFAIIPVVFSAFCFAACIYSFNMLTDLEEDRINGSVNPIAFTPYGKLIPVVFFFAGTVISFSISLLSFTLYLTACLAGITYSAFRFKKIFGVKNAYTIVVTSLIFFLGSSMRPFTAATFEYALLFSIPMLIVSLTGDLRDYKGDLKAGIPTLPVAFGYGAAKRLAYLLCASLAMAVAMKGPASLLPLAISSLPSAHAIGNSRPEIAQLFIMLGVIAVPLVMLWR